MRESALDVGVSGVRVGQSECQGGRSRLHRDPSIISRLYFAYAADRDQKNEKLLAKRLQK
jgi:hypothetical protein